MNIHNSTARRAFTIIELLVALGVTAILVTLMLAITINVLNGWNRSSGKLSNENQARLVLDQLSQDLQGAVLKHDANAWLVATLQRDQTTMAGDAAMSGTPFASAWSAATGGSVKPLSANGSLVIDPNGKQAKEYRFGQAGVWLRFFSVPPDNEINDIKRASAPRAISFQMIRTRVKGSDQYTYALFRSEVRPANPADDNSTFGVGYDLFMDEGTAISYNNGNAVDGNVGNIRRPPGNSVIAVNVIDFGIKLLGKNGTNEVELFPVRRDAAAVPISPIPTTGPFTFAASSRSATPAPTVTGLGTIQYGYPTAAEIMIRILSPQGVRLIDALEAGKLPNPDGLTTDQHWWDIAEKNSDVFTRRIEIRSSAL